MLALTGLTPFYQNCAFSSRSSGVSTDAYSSNGNNVDLGGLYVHPKSEGLCPDGDINEMKIRYESGVPVLIRDKCTDLSVEEQLQVRVDADPSDSSFIVYNGAIFVDSHSFFRESAVDRTGAVYSIATQISLSNREKFTFVAKIDPQGARVWTKRLRTDQTQELTSIRVLKSGNVLLAGRAEIEATSWGLIVVLAPDGQTFWARAFASAPATVPVFSDADADSAGNIYVTGELRSTKGLPTESFVMKLNPKGEVLWQTALASENGWLNKIRVSIDGLDVYAAGNLAGNGQTPGGVLKLASINGTLVWSRVFPSVVYALREAHDGGVTFAGAHAQSNMNIIAKLTPSATLAFATQFQSAGDSLSSVRGLTERPDGSYLASGVALRSTIGLVGTVSSLTAQGSLEWSFQYRRTGYDAFQSGHTDLVNGKAWIAALTSTPDGQQLGSLLQIEDSSEQTRCRLCTIQSDLSSTSMDLPSKAGPKPRAVQLFSSVPIFLELGTFQIKPEIR